MRNNEARNMTSTTPSNKDKGICFSCKSLGDDKHSCTQDYLFLVDKRTCAGFESTN